METGYLGIDVGTQGLSVILVDQRGKLLATGDGQYDMVAGLANGCYEQRPQDWELALTEAMQQLRQKLADRSIDFQVAAIGISGQMHGEVLIDSQGNPVGNARLWCDSRNEDEGAALTTEFGKKIPKRMTVARWWWTIRNRPDVARRVAHLTTPGGWLAYRLTGELNLGIGDASGMFPIDQQTLDYDQNLLAQFDQASGATSSLKEMLPRVRTAGQSAGALNDRGSQLLGLPIGIPVAPSEGDQPASLAGSLIGAAGMVAVSFGTSVCANSVGDRDFVGVHRIIDHFCAPDGKPINMVFLRNGTTFMNAMVQAFAQSSAGLSGGISDSPAAITSATMGRLMSDVLSAPADCGGLLATPFMDDEPGLGIRQGGSGTLFGLNAQNATPGTIVKAAMLATMFNLKLGLEVLDHQGYPRTEIFLSGGVTKTPELGQVLADVLNTPVSVDEGAAEGCAYGAALMARYCAQQLTSNSAQSWEQFLSSAERGEVRRFEPQSQAAVVYGEKYVEYQKLLNRLFEN